MMLAWAGSGPCEMIIRPRHQGGFTLAEIMVVTGIIGMLAAIAMPNFVRARENALNGRFAGDLRTMTGAFEMYYAEHGKFPNDKTPGIVPDGMEPYLGHIAWNEPTSLGGDWDWDFQVFGVTAGVSVRSPQADEEQLKRLDRMIDDGNLDSGNFRRRSGGYMLVIAD